MAVNLGSIWFSIQSNVTSLVRATRAVVTFGQTAQTAANQTGAFQRSLNALSTASVLVNGPLGGIAARFQAIASSARKGNLGVLAIVGGIGTAAYAFYRLVNAAIDARIAFQRVQLAAEAVAGSSFAAAKELDYIRTIAASTGQEFYGLAQQYVFLQAASEGTNLEGVKTRRIFSVTAAAAAKLNLSIADTEGVMRALQQMMSKGTIQAEELRGQLGDRLPGAFKIMAQGLGVTTAQLTEMLKKGEVLAEDALPKFADALAKAYSVDLTKPVDSIIANQNRLSNAWQQTLLALDEVTSASRIWNELLAAQAGLLEGLTGALDTYANWLKVVGFAASHSAEELLMLGRMKDAFGSDFGTEDPNAVDWLQKRIDLQTALNEKVKEYNENRFGDTFGAKGDSIDRITNSELENWLKAQKTAGAKASEGLREAQVTLAKLNMEADVYANNSGRDLNIALRELDRAMEISSKVESFSDALRSAGVATGVVNAMTEKYRQTLEAVQNAKLLDESTVSTFEYLETVIGTGLTSAMDNFVGALEKGKITMETLKDTARDVVSMMLKEFIKLAWINPIMNGIFGQSNPVFSLGNIAGAIVGGGGVPRMHGGGIARDEMPAILQKGEVVLSKNQARKGMGGGPINYSPTINVQGSADNMTIERMRRLMLTDVERVLPEMIARGRLSRKF